MRDQQEQPNAGRVLHRQDEIVGDKKLNTPLGVHLENLQAKYDNEENVLNKTE